MERKTGQLLSLVSALAVVAALAPAAPALAAKGGDGKPRLTKKQKLREAGIPVR